jgi:CheY-like chemotaxis protein
LKSAAADPRLRRAKREERGEHAAEAGALAYLSKPFPGPSLVEAVTKALAAK